MALRIALIFIAITVIGAVLIAIFINRMLANASSGFELIDENKSPNYFHKEGKVYYCLGGNFFSLGERLLEDADFASFTIMDSYLAKDRQHVYISETKLEGSDPDSFELIDTYYALDKAQVYYIASVITEASPESFKVLEGNFSRDASKLFYREHIVTNVNPDEFVYQEGMYAQENEDGEVVLVNN